jgi:ribosome-associated heat shock protein Hsp15
MSHRRGEGAPPDQAAAVRVDRWLCAARFFASRTQGTAACESGSISVNGVPAKASHKIQIGDEVKGQTPRGTIVVDVLALAEKRLSPTLARTLYRDRSPPPPPPDQGCWTDPGRPATRDRRALRQLRGK